MGFAFFVNSSPEKKGGVAKGRRRYSSFLWMINSMLFLP